MKYLVMDAGASMIGPVIVREDNEGRRFVEMTQTQAEIWIERGVLSGATEPSPPRPTNRRAQRYGEP